jgi:CCR4-NOT transcription complex subunit 7/8
LLKQHGISPQYFGEKIISSGLVLNSHLTWICFHGCFDMAYFVKILTNEKLPSNKNQYHTMLEIFFPRLLDIKSFVYSQIRFDSGLQRIGEYLGVMREGTMHQAGSDAMLTLQIFFAIFNNLETEQDRREFKIICDQFNQEIYGYTNEQAHRFVTNFEPVGRNLPQPDASLQMDAAIFDPQMVSQYANSYPQAPEQHPADHPL